MEMVLEEIEIAGIKVFLSRKKIKNLYLKITPPHGDVIISAPARLTMKNITDFVTKRLEWIKKNQSKVKNKAKNTSISPPLKFISGEKHLLFGRELELLWVKNSKKNQALYQNGRIELHSSKKVISRQKRQKILDDFYRLELKKVIPIFILQYEKIMNLELAEFAIKKMKTRWGTCNIKARRIWINLELAKRPIESLEYIIVHEMTHLFEANHNKRFYSLMDNFMPNWRQQDRKISGTLIMPF